MKKVCKKCQGELQVKIKPFATGVGSHAHLICKNCGMHNQFCPKNDIYLYEEIKCNSDHIKKNPLMN